MRVFLAIFPVVAFLTLSVIAQQGTAEILAENPESAPTALFVYYLKLAMSVSLVGFIYDQLIRRYFATYESGTHT
tara:strand:+ start:493 stop:717 length:225 start_codon:yes stop_codon:yes gene_type:complete